MINYVLDLADSTWSDWVPVVWNSTSRSLSIKRTVRPKHETDEANETEECSPKSKYGGWRETHDVREHPTTAVLPPCRSALRTPLNIRDLSAQVIAA
jgi:hypothetical protein